MERQGKLLEKNVRKQQMMETSEVMQRMERLPKLKVLAPTGKIMQKRRLIDFDMKMSAIEVHVVQEIMRQNKEIDTFDFNKIFKAKLGSQEMEMTFSTLFGDGIKKIEPVKNYTIQSTFYDHDAERAKHRIPKEHIEAR